MLYLENNGNETSRPDNPGANPGLEAHEITKSMKALPGGGSQAARNPGSQMQSTRGATISPAPLLTRAYA